MRSTEGWSRRCPARALPARDGPADIVSCNAADVPAIESAAQEIGVPCIRLGVTGGERFAGEGARPCEEGERGDDTSECVDEGGGEALRIEWRAEKRKGAKIVFFVSCCLSLARGS